MTTRELISKLQTDDPAYWAWLQQHPTALQNVKNLAQNYQHFPAYYSAVQKLKSYVTFSAGGTEDEGEVPPEEFPPEEEFDPGFDADEQFRAEAEARENQSILDQLTSFLDENELPRSLMGFIQQALANKWSFSKIIAEIRATPEYKAAYPENELRQERGLSWMAEAEIRGYRDEAKRLAREYMGVDVTNAEISNLIGRGTSLRSWEHRLQVNDAVERFGGAVQQVFESYTGAPLANERLHMFFDPDVTTSELDNMYELALRRGQPALLGFAVRPEDEAKLLQSMGIPVEQVFKNYQNIRSELPRFTRLAAIGQYLNDTSTDFFGDVSVSGSLLFRAVQLGDPAALNELQRRSAEEAARWQAGGGPAQTQGGTFAGLAVR
jgi:hypothetical protein